MRPTAIKLTAAILLFCGYIPAIAQDKLNVVTTAVPFLRISPDARSGGMGDVGLATAPDASSAFFNIGKVPFNKNKGGIVATYTPWLNDLVKDVYLLSVAGFVKFDEEQALSGSVRYFSLGDIQFTDGMGQDLQSYRPREFGIDIGYSRKLSKKVGLGVSLKYISSNLTGGFTQGSTTYKTGTAVAGDIGFYANNQNAAGDGWAFGVALTNLGSKIAYTDNADMKDFIPANLGLGTTYSKNFDASNKITVGLDINKLMVPTPPGNASNPPTAQQLADYRSTSVLASWFKSFGDADDGFSEELKEFQISLGAEYWYNNQFAVRAGYFYENKDKGNRRYLTAGVGLRYNVLGLNFSYLVPSGSGVNRNPLSNTVRFSVLFDIEGSGAAKK